jgi:hypothetical protein
MSALLKIQSAGFDVALVNGNLNITPTKKEFTDAQRIFIKKHKTEIVKEISATQIQQNIRDSIEERAAIIEFDGGLSRQDADVAATNAMRVYCYRVTDKPDSELVTLKPNIELTEATQELKERYGDRLLSVTPMTFNQTKH